MAQVLERIKTVNAGVWLLLVLAAVLTYGASKIVTLCKIREDKIQLATIILKSIGMACALAACIIVLVL